jgi:hypothetical protein
MDEMTSRLARGTRGELAFDDLLSTLRHTIARVRATSYLLSTVTHPTGFYAVELARGLGPSILRIHIWREGERPQTRPSWPIHSHAWHFQSVTLLGELEDRVYEVVPDKNGAHQLYQAEFDWHISRLVATGSTVACELLTASHYPAGRGHVIEAGVFHDTVVSQQGYTASLVLISEPRDIRPYVVGELDGASSYDRAQDRRPSSLTGSLVTEFLDRLETCS